MLRTRIAPPLRARRASGLRVDCGPALAGGPRRRLRGSLPPLDRPPQSPSPLAIHGPFPSRTPDSSQSWLNLLIFL
jgi:hypothetical protein